MEIRKLTVPELKFLYRGEMLRSFPANEIKKYRHIRKGVKKGTYYGYGAFIDNKLSAYALICVSDRVGLLDYLAVNPELRGQGIGKKMVEYLIKNEMNLIIEADSPDLSPNEAEKAVRVRRIHFYDNCGCINTGVKARIEDCPFILLATKETVSPEDYYYIYNAMVPSFVKRGIVWADI